MRNKYTALIVFLLILALTISGCTKAATGSSEINDKLELAIKYLADNEYEEAVLTFQEVIKIEPKTALAYRGLSVAYSLQDKKDQAEQALQDGIKQVTDQNTLQLAMAGVLEDQGNKDQAEALYQELSSKDPNLLKYYVNNLISHGKESEAETVIASQANNINLYESYNILAEAYMEKGNQDKAAALLNKSFTAKPIQAAVYNLYEKMFDGKWDSLLTLGDQISKQNQVLSGQVMKLIALYNLGNYDEMVKQYDQASNDVKAFPKAKLLIAEASAKQGNKEQGISLVKEIKTDEIQDTILIADLADYYLEAGDKEMARKLATLGLRIDMFASENYVVLYKSYLGEDETLARVWLMKYLLNSPYGVQASNLEQLMVRALKLNEDGKHNEAITVCYRILKIDNNSAEAYTIMGSAYNHLKQYQKAIQKLDNAIKINPKLTTVYDLRAWSYNSLQQYEKGVIDSTKALELDPNNYSAYDHRAWAFNALKQFNKALDDANKGLAINPKYYYLYNMRAVAYLGLGQSAKALEEVNNTFELKADDSTALSLQAAINRELGLGNKAR